MLFPGLSIDELDGKSRAELLLLLDTSPLQRHSTDHDDAPPAGGDDDQGLEGSTEIAEDGDPAAERSWEESSREAVAFRASDDINAMGLATDQHSRSYLGVTSISAVMKTIFTLCPAAKQHTAERARTWTEAQHHHHHHNQPRQSIRPGLLPPITATGSSSNALRELRCIGFYFDTVHAITPIINEAEFRGHYTAGRRHDRSWLALLNMVLTLGSLASGSDSLHNQYYEQARLHLDLDSLGSGNTELLQALCLLGGFYLHYRNSPNMAYAVLGAAHRVAIALGLHRDPVRSTRAAAKSAGPEHSSSHAARIETRRRTWWGLFCLDTWASTTLGRPTCGRWDSTTMNTLLPSPILSSPDNKNKNNNEDEDDRHMAASLRASCLFCSISNRIQHRFAQPARLSAHEALAFDRELTDWHADLPPELKDPAVVVARLAVARDFMRNRYYNVRLVLSRCFLLYHAHDSRLGRGGGSSNNWYYAELSPGEAALIESCRDIAARTIDAITLSWTPDRIHVWNSAWELFQACMVPLLSIAVENDLRRSSASRSGHHHYHYRQQQQQQHDLSAQPNIGSSAPGAAGQRYPQDLANTAAMPPECSELISSCRGSLVKAIETLVEMSPWMRPSDRALDIVVAVYEALTADGDNHNDHINTNNNNGGESHRTPSAATDSSGGGGLDMFGWFDEHLMMNLDWAVSLNFEGVQMGVCLAPEPPNF